MASEKTPRIVTRGEQVTFRSSFFADTAQTIPLVPIDPTMYPSYNIRDINGTIIQSGLGIQDTLPGFWKIDYMVGKTAPLSYDLKRWRVEWYFVTNANRQVNFVEEFDVRDVVITASESREIKKLALSGKEFLVFTRQTVRPYSLKLQLLSSNSPISMGGNTTISGGGTPQGWSSSDIRETVEGDSFVYSYKIPEGTLNGGCGYSVLWQVQETQTSQIDFEFQSLYVIPPSVFHLMDSLRMVIDRFQKRLGRVQAYEDSDLWEYLVRGLQVVNGWHPFTAFNIFQVPDGLQSHWIMAAAWWGVNAQHLLETDMQFDFSGQTVTLNYDHTANLEAAIGRFIDYLEKTLTPAKVAIVRASTPCGAFAGRPYRIRALHNFVFKIDSNPAQNVMTVLSQIGLL